MVNFANSLAYERGVENVVIDLTDTTIEFYNDEDILVTIASEPWWYSNFWRLAQNQLDKARPFASWCHFGLSHTYFLLTSELKNSSAIT